MDIAWDQYKPLLRRAYFGESDCSLAPRDSDVAKDFWKFFNRYVAMAIKKGIKAERSKKKDEKGFLNDIGAPSGQYSKLHRRSALLDLDKTAKYSLREVPSYVISEFEYIIHGYLEFCQREKFRKLKHLRRAQASLPIAAFKDKIVNAVHNNSVVIIAGDTGCGKSTQVPQYLLQGGFEHVACTQPRRIACISLSKRVAYETLNQFATQIAYQIRFEKTRTAATKILFLTEGLLLRQMTSDPDLNMYQVIILDEVHERHLHGDLLIGLLRSLAQKRGDLKLLLMSATINLELFSNYFPDAPVLQVPGRLYPIDMHYIPPVDQMDDNERKKESDRIDPAPYRRVLAMIDSKCKPSERGDVLIFLSGISEISTVAEALKMYAEQTHKWIILMLHSTLSLEEQDKVFDVAPDGVRKCVLSTNIAETSVTIDGVRFVVDSGKVKEMRYDGTTRIHQLKEIWVSQASAEQRKGRAGRTGPGICYRLYKPEEYAKFDPYTTSEIRRVSLESLALQMYSLDLSVDIRQFSFIETPDAGRLEESIECLKDQGAVLSRKCVSGAVVDELSALGRMLVNLPVDVAVGKMLIMGCLFQQVEAVLTVAAGLSVQSPFTNRSYRDQECISFRQNLVSDHGDPFALLNTYREWLQVKADGSESTRRWCRKRGIEEQRLYEISKLRNQFKQLLEDADLIEKSSWAQAPVGSAERRIRAGEMKRLRDLKRKHRHEEKKRKVLKPNEHYDTLSTGMEENEEGEGAGPSADSDLHAVEFQMRHSLAELTSGLEHHRMNFSTASLIKMILCAGLYPQYGILDMHNSYRIGTDQMLHTRAKPFMVLHPNSCLAQDPECLAIMKDKEGLSANHQSIFYSLLLETTKPYVVNSVRVPALHTLLLFARKINTSSDFTRIVCDDFCEFVLLSPSQSEELVSSASDIRTLLSDCLERKVQGDTYRSTSLARKLISYLQTEVFFSMKRLVGSDTKIAKNATADGKIAIGTVPSASDNLSGASEYVSVKWTCMYCEQEFYSNASDKIEHIRTCDQRMNEEQVVEKKEEEEYNPLKREYFCEHCNQSISLTPVEILRHKKSHK